MSWVHANEVTQIVAISENLKVMQKNIIIWRAEEGQSANEKCGDLIWIFIFLFVKKVSTENIETKIFVKLIVS